jgi:hypothetical protein
MPVITPRLTVPRDTVGSCESELLFSLRATVDNGHNARYQEYYTCMLVLESMEKGVRFLESTPCFWDQTHEKIPILHAFTCVRAQATHWRGNRHL